MKTKKPPIYDPNGEITPFQIQSIRQLCNFNEEEKNKLILQATNGKTSSLKALKQAQAIEIIKQFSGNENKTIAKQVVTEFWAYYYKENTQHRYILSLLIQLGWSVKSNKYGEIADLNRFSDWLKSRRSPVQKPLKSMSPEEISKIISALESMIVKNYELL
ncbi:hypothetical protein FLACOL_01092 [Flavobacterium columnare]|uniref:DUF1018 domain-containing protein n=2 Tax=Flavobacterium TaxID=237 RepID=A0ABW8PLC8_9FLAO|nr:MULTISPECIES: hypothetical protein [Flavobacterium]QYS89084.1 hypothetical protein JJC05_01185 [Flavobacterium davisii]SPE77102.1 hypothetical protein FLACOL_01092 [Flavobacterium columnare]